MSVKHSIAARKRWEGISPEEKKRRMTALAFLKQKKMTKKQKRDHALMMVKARSK